MLIDIVGHRCTAANCQHALLRDRNHGQQHASLKSTCPPVLCIMSDKSLERVINKGCGNHLSLIRSCSNESNFIRSCSSHSHIIRSCYQPVSHVVARSRDLLSRSFLTDSTCACIRNQSCSRYLLCVDCFHIGVLLMFPQN